MRTSLTTALTTALILGGAAFGATAADAKGGGATGTGGIAGDTFQASVIYSAADCPVPAALDASTLDITYCALGATTAKPGDLKIRIAGHTTLPAGTTQIKAAATVGVGACTGFADRFVVSSSAVILPVGSPNTLFAESGKLAVSC